MRDYSEYIAQMRKEWIGHRVLFVGQEFTVVDVDYNGCLLIDKKARFTETTAVDATMVRRVGQQTEETWELLRCPYQNGPEICPYLDLECGAHAQCPQGG